MWDWLVPIEIILARSSKLFIWIKAVGHIKRTGKAFKDRNLVFSAISAISNKTSCLSFAVCCSQTLEQVIHLVTGSTVRRLLTSFNKQNKLNKSDSY